MLLKFAFIGFGNVAREFARLLLERSNQLEQQYSLTFRVTAIATANHGCVTSATGIDLREAVVVTERGGNLSELAGVVLYESPFEIVERCDADVIFETTTLNPTDGTPALDYIRGALARRINVVSANKAPVAFAYRELKRLAAQYAVSYRFEGAVMDGAPIFNLVERCLPAVRILGFEGVLNSTSNLVLTLMESGRSFEEAVWEAQRHGVAEADPSYDLEGLDAEMKARALANVLMNAEARAVHVDRVGILGITSEDLSAARRQGLAIRPRVTAVEDAGDIMITIKPEPVPVDSILGSLNGTSNALILKTNVMGELAIVETDPGLRQTAYALLSDLLTICSP